MSKSAEFLSSISTKSLKLSLNWTRTSRNKNRVSKMSAKYDPFLAFFLSFELMKIDDHGTMHLDGLSDFDG